MLIQRSDGTEDNHMVLAGLNAGYAQPGRSPAMMNQTNGFKVNITDTGVAIG